jgi:PqqD family protein of HPr-rel-A system
MSTKKPVRTPGIVVQDVGDEILLYSAEGKAIHVLNPTARRIWELCDGEHTTADLVQALQASFSIGAEHDVTTDIRRTLADLAARGLLQPE